MRFAQLSSSLLLLSLTVACDTRHEPASSPSPEKPIRELPVEEPGAPTPGSPIDMPPTPPAETGPGCAGKSFLTLQGVTLNRVTTDGSSQALFTFGASSGLEMDYLSLDQWEQAGRFHAIVAYLELPIHYAFEYVVLRDDGVIVTHQVIQHEYSPSIFLSADGTLAISSDVAMILRTDGTSTDLGRMHPVSALRPDGFLLVADGEPWTQGVSYAWFNPSTGVRIAEPAAEYVNIQVFGDALLHEVPVASGGVGIAVTTPASTRTFDPEVGAGGWWQLLGQADGRFLLLGLNTDRVVRLDVTTGVFAQVTVPPFPEEAQQGPFGVAMLSGGDLARMFPVAGEKLQLRRSHDLGATWTDVGEPMERGQDFGLGSHLVPVERGGHMLILNYSTGYGDFLNGVQLASPTGNVLTVMAGGLYVNVLIDPGAADLSADGTCAATWTVRDDAETFDQVVDLVLMDAVTNTTRVIRQGDRLGALRFW